MADQVHYSMTEFDKDAEKVYQDVLKSGYCPDMILGIARGGIPFANFIAEKFKLPINTVYISFYDGQVRRSNPIINTLGIRFESTKRILAIDDLADSGDTLLALKNVFDLLHLQYKFATLFTKPTSKVEVDFYARRTTDWIVFPWEDKT